MMSLQLFSLDNQVSTGNQFCSHPSKFYSKEKYNNRGMQIGKPYDNENKNHSRCSKCGAEFARIQDAMVV